MRGLREALAPRRVVRVCTLGGAIGAAASGVGAGEGGVVLGLGNTTGEQPDGSSCAQVVRKGETVPLDMYILLDKSSSMLDTTSAGPTKWDAIRSALESFVSDPASQ